MEKPDQPYWVVDLSLSRTVEPPQGPALPRSAFLEDLWELLDGTGLCGMQEGFLDAADAAALGIAATALVIDAAEGDPDRDWVAAAESTTASLWFDGERGAREAAARLGGLAGCSVLGLRREGPHDWEAEARAGHGPIEVPGFGTILAPWHAVAGSGEDGIQMVIDPGIGFGTGLHPTTRLCLAEVAAACRSAGPSPIDVLDVGAGSGILGIAAALLGAGRIDAVEIDGRVHDAIRHNAALNGVAGRMAVTATLDDLAPATRYDCVVANIVAGVLLAHADDLCRLVRRGGSLILGGLRDDDRVPILDRCTALLGAEPAIATSEGWCCAHFRRPAPGSVTAEP